MKLRGRQRVVVEFEGFIFVKFWFFTYSALPGWAMEKWKALVWLLANIALSVVMVLLNKYIYSSQHFPNVTLTFIHFTTTSLCMEASQKFGVFMVKSLPMKDMMVLSLCFSGFVVLTNLSLQENSVGTYQVSKFMTTPCIILIQTLIYGKEFSTSIKLTLLPICLGVFLNNYNDLHLNWRGLSFATVGVLITSIYQVLVGSKQHELQANSMQLLYYQAPLSASLLLGYILLCESPFKEGGVLVYNWPSTTIIAVVASGFIAFFLNMSIFWVIGNTSPLTYNMAGHLKFSRNDIGGFLWFDELPTLFQLSGIMLTLLGVGVYTYLKLKEQQSKADTSISNRP